MFGLGTSETIVLTAVVLLLLGPKKIPEIAENIGVAIRHIRGVFSAASDVETPKK